MNSIAARVYYKEPYLWLIWGLLAAVVVASFITLTIAMRSPDGLVADDYYKQGLAINQSLEAYHRAAELGVVADIQYQYDQLVVTIHSDTELPPHALRLSWIHPTDPNKDMTASLIALGFNRDVNAYQWQVARLPSLHSALKTPLNWQLLLQSEAENGWKVRGRWLPAIQQSSQLKPLSVVNLSE